MRQQPHSVALDAENGAALTKEVEKAYLEDPH